MNLCRNYHDYIKNIEDLGLDLRAGDHDAVSSLATSELRDDTEWLTNLWYTWGRWSELTLAHIFTLLVYTTRLPEL